MVTGRSGSLLRDLNAFRPFMGLRELFGFSALVSCSWGV